MTSDPFCEWVADTVQALSSERPTRVAASIEDAPEPAQGFPCVMLAARPCGVYHLYFRGHLQYVGQSTNVFTRLASHMQTARFEFDAFQVFQCAPKDLLAKEAADILRLRPLHNRVYPAGNGRAKEYRGPNATLATTKRKTKMQPTQENTDPQQDMPEDGYETDAAGTFKG